MQPTGSRDANYFYLMDLVRFLAALSVLVFHLGYSTWQSRSDAAHIVQGLYTIPEGSVFWWGSVGVQIFFVISGFVIANSARQATPMKFVRGRMLRLYPTAWICATISLAVALLYGFYSPAETAVRYLVSMTLFPTGPWMEGVYWTLALEILFYAMVFFLILLKKFDRLESFSTAMAVYSGFFVFYVSMAKFGVIEHWSLLDKVYDLGKKILLMGYGIYFALGMHLWLWSAGRLSKPGRVVMLATLLLCVMQIGAASFTKLDNLYQGVGQIGQQTLEALPGGLSLDWRIPVLVFLGCLALIVASFRFQGINRRFSPGMLSLLRLLGMTTYPLYLVHFSLGVTLVKVLFLAGLTPLTAFVLASGIVLTISVVIAKYIEPVLQLQLKAVLDRGIQRWVPIRAR